MDLGLVFHSQWLPQVFVQHGYISAVKVALCECSWMIADSGLGAGVAVLMQLSSYTCVGSSQVDTLHCVFFSMCAMFTLSAVCFISVKTANLLLCVCVCMSASSVGWLTFLASFYSITCSCSNSNSLGTNQWLQLLPLLYRRPLHW